MSQLAQRLIMAAGGGKKDYTYVDDVFSTDLYKGNGATKGDSQAIDNGIKLGNANVGNSVNFDGSGDYLSIPNSTAWDIGTNYTAECFFYIDRIVGSGWDAIFGQWPGSNNAATNTWVLEYVGASTLYFYYNDGSQSMQNVSLGNVSRGAWHHFAFSKEGSNTRLFIDGNLTQTITPTYWNGTGSFNIGGNVASGGWINGNVSNVRITKDQALYTSNFTPTTAELTTTSKGATASNVKLLCCQSSTSTTAATVTPGTITANGDVRSQAFGPFTGEGAKGGMVWIKSRDNSYWHSVVDTERGANKTVYPNSTWQEETLTNLLNSFNNSGFISAYNSSYSQVFANKNNDDYAAWTFAKQEGFFDVVTYSGNNTAGRAIPHNLGSIPGCIMVKRLDTSDSWQVYHRGNVTGDQNAAHYWLNLDQETNKTNSNSRWNDTEPTASVFTVGADAGVNTSGGQYVAYLFAGGNSDEAGSARSIDFDNNDYLSLAATTDLNLTGDFTIEFWVYPRSQSTSRQTIMQTVTWGAQYAVCQISNQTQSGLESKAQIWDYDMNQGYAIAYSKSDVQEGVWTHVAFTRQSGTIRVFLNGILDNSFTGLNDSIEFGHTTALIGNHSSTYYLGASLSNFRIVNGTAVYTTSFKPPTTGLTDITNTKLLCCNKNTPTGSTVTPGTITSHNGPESIVATPFDDPAGFIFGKDGDQNIIKCGYYDGNGSSAGPKVDVGFEPQWVIVKNTSSNSSLWLMADSMRGVVTKGSVAGDDPYLQANSGDPEYTTYDWIEFTPTGFNLTNTGNSLNTDGNRYVYIAIRRPDGYVGKPPEAGIDVFNQVYGNYSSGNNPIPNFTAGFPVDFGWAKSYGGGGGDWWTSARLIQKKEVQVNTNIPEQSGTNKVFDSNIGWHNNNGYDWYESHMWKRGAGFDVQTYTGKNFNGARVHNLGQVPEMMWVKRTDTNSDWAVYHKDLHQYPQDYYLVLNSSAGLVNASQWWKPPTSTHWFTAIGGLNNINNAKYMALLFSSVNGISKVGTYAGTGASGNSQNFGFQPRFLIVKKFSTGAGAAASGGWHVLDTLRGWGAGNDSDMELQNTAAAVTQIDWGAPTATGWDMGNNDIFNESGYKFIYYAHA